MRTAILIIGLFLMLLTPFIAYASLDMMSDPLDILKSKNPHLTQQQIDIYKKQTGLDKPLVVRFFYWFNSATKGDFGIFKSGGENVFFLVMILLASLLSGIAAAFAIAKPFVSVVIFVAAAFAAFFAPALGLSCILLLLAVFSYFGHKELKKKALGI